MFHLAFHLILGISIHALREEGDLMRELAIRIKDISIHALREEGDAVRIFIVVLKQHFYPRPPRGGRPASPRPLPRMESAFLSTPSARRAT